MRVNKVLEYILGNNCQFTIVFVFFETAKHSPPDTMSNLRENGDARTLKDPTSVSERKGADEGSNDPKVEKVVVDRAAASLGVEDVDTDRPQRPMSPGTLALMCDEKDPVFTAPPSPTGGLAAEDVNTATGSSHAALLYAAQERAILLEYRDCLRRVISVGKRRGMFCTLSEGRLLHVVKRIEFRNDTKLMFH